MKFQFGIISQRKLIENKQKITAVSKLFYIKSSFDPPKPQKLCDYLISSANFSSFFILKSQYASYLNSISQKENLSADHQTGHISIYLMMDDHNCNFCFEKLR